MHEYCKHGLEKPGQLLGLPQVLHFFLSFFWQYFHALLIYIHSDSLPVAHSALQSRDASSTKPGTRMCFQIIQVKSFILPVARGGKRSQELSFIKFLYFVGTVMRSLSSWIGI